MKFFGMEITTGSISKEDANVQDYVESQHKREDGKATPESEARLGSAASKLPSNIKNELDERLKRGTI